MSFFNYRDNRTLEVEEIAKSQIESELKLWFEQLTGHRVSNSLIEYAYKPNSNLYYLMPDYLRYKTEKVYINDPLTIDEWKKITEEIESAIRYYLY